MSQRPTITGLVLTMLLLVSATVGANSISFNPSAQTTPVGSTVTLGLLISNPLAQVGSYDLDVQFNPAILSPVAVAFGPFLGSPANSVSGTLFSSGRVNLFEVSFLTPAALIALQPGVFTAATLSFITLSSGTTALTLSSNTVGDLFGVPLSPTLINGSVTSGASPVPEPTAVTLVLLGLTARRWLRRSR
jgi:hypothetical protein